MFDVFLKSDRHYVSLSAIGHLPLPAHDSVTVYLMMSCLPIARNISLKSENSFISAIIPRYTIVL